MQPKLNPKVLSGLGLVDSIAAKGTKFRHRGPATAVEPMGFGTSPQSSFRWGTLGLARRYNTKATYRRTLRTNRAPNSFVTPQNQCLVLDHPEGLIEKLITTMISVATGIVLLLIAFALLSDFPGVPQDRGDNPTPPPEDVSRSRL
jgi:hypothetical protein